MGSCREKQDPAWGAGAMISARDTAGRGKSNSIWQVQNKIPRVARTTLIPATCLLGGLLIKRETNFLLLPFFLCSFIFLGISHIFSSCFSNSLPFFHWYVRSRDVQTWKGAGTPPELGGSRCGTLLRAPSSTAEDVPSPIVSVIRNNWSPLLPYFFLLLFTIEKKYSFSDSIYSTQ